MFNLDVALVSQEFLDLVYGLIIDDLEVASIFLWSPKYPISYISGKKYLTKAKFKPV